MSRKAVELSPEELAGDSLFLALEMRVVANTKETFNAGVEKLALFRMG